MSDPKYPGRKKIGIVCDDYKVRNFRRALERHAFEFDVVPLDGQLKGHTCLGVYVLPQDFQDSVKAIAKICKKLEIDFHRSN